MKKKIHFEEVNVFVETPQDDELYLWYDSTGVTKTKALLTYKDAKEMIPFLFDSWLKPVLTVELEVMYA